MNGTQIIGWTLVHSIWQFAAIGLLFLVSRLVMRSSQAQYAAGLIALGLCLLAPVCTMAVLSHHTSGETPFSTTVASVGPAAPSAIRAAPSFYRIPIGAISSERSRIDDALRAVVRLWAIGLALMSVRLLGGLLAVYRMRRNGSACTDSRVLAAVDSLRSSLGLKREIDVRLSNAIGSPAVIGFLKSVVLLPVSILVCLTPEQLEAVLAHEMAHIRRFDYIANLMQSFAETVFFYHPAVWWISHVVRTERENCCDDLAMKLVGDRSTYARALVALEQMRVSSPRLAPAANGGSLVHRIRRIVLGPQRAFTNAWGYVAVLVLVCVFLGLAQRISAQSVNTKPAGNIRAESELPKPIDRPNVSDAVAVGKIRTEGVVLRPDGKPEAGATVECVTVDRNSMEIKAQEKTADENGRFEFQIPAKVYVDLAAVGADGIGVDALQPNGSRTVRLQPFSPVSVQVVDTAGRPLSGVMVEPKMLVIDGKGITSFGGFLHRFASATNGEGVATLNVPKGSASFGSGDDRYAVEPDSLYPAEKVSPGQAVRGDSPEEPVKLVFEPACEIEGVLVKNGAPIDQSVIGLTSPQHFYSEPVGVDNSGRFDLKRLPAGQAWVAASLPQSLDQEWCVEPVSVNLRPGVQHVNLNLIRGSLLRGTIIDKRGKRVSDATVTIRGANEMIGLHSVAVAADGTFFIRMPAGVCHVTVWRSGHTSSLEVEVKPNEPKSFTIVMPERDAAIQVRVLDELGMPVPRTEVHYRYHSPDGHQQSGGLSMTDESGWTTIYLPTEAFSTVRFSAVHGGQFSDGEVAPVGSTVTLRLKTRKLTSLSGLVLDSGGRPIPGAQVSLAFTAATDFSGDAATMGPKIHPTDSKGRFRIDGLMPGTWLMTLVQAKGFADAQTDIVKLGAAPNSVGPIRLELGRTLSGRVVDQFGHPVVGAQLSIQGPARVRGLVETTDSKGRFAFDRIPVGARFQISIFKNHKTVRPWETGTLDGTYVMKR